MITTELIMNIVGTAVILDDVNCLSQIDKEQLPEEKMEGTVRSEMLLKSAHDLSGSLASLKIFLQLMLKGAVSCNDNDVLDHLLKKVEYMDRLIQDMFFLSKMETNQLQFRFQKIKVNSWLSNVVVYYRQDLSAVDMELSLGQRAETLLGDPDAHAWLNIDVYRLNQVLRNYLDNAIKYSRAGNNKIELEAYVTQLPKSLKGDLVVTITDHGVGLNKKEQSKVFDQYYSKRKNGMEGNGLGLAIAREIVHRHQGQVGVESQSGNGSKFSITLPVEFLET